jgi:hypothetical protein
MASDPHGLDLRGDRNPALAADPNWTTATPLNFNCYWRSWYRD